MPQSETPQLAEKVSEILEKDIPDIRIRLVEVSGKQDRIFEKLGNVEKSLVEHIEVAKDSNRIVQRHEVRLASLEDKDAEQTKKRDSAKYWLMTIISSVATAVFLYVLRRLGWVT
jgi:hypothetical protein